MLLAVDEERWCSVDAAAHATEEIGLYLRGESGLRQASRSPRSDSPKCSAKAQYQREPELVLVDVKPIVHFPEPVVRPRVLGRLSGRLRERVRLGQWEVPENEPELLAEPLLRQLDVREGKAAVRTLVVAIFDHCDRRVVGTLDVVGGCDGYSQKTHDVTAAGSFSNASRMPSAPGLTATGDKVAPENDALPVDHEQRTIAYAFTWAVSAVTLGDIPLRLKFGQQREMQMPVPGERLMTPSAVDRDPEQLGFMLAEFRQDLIESFSELGVLTGGWFGRDRRGERAGWQARAGFGRLRIGLEMRSVLGSRRSLARAGGAFQAWSMSTSARFMFIAAAAN